MNKLHPDAAAQVVVEACKQFPKASNRSLAKRLAHEHPAQFPTLNSAYCAVRYYRGRRGNDSRRAVQIHNIPLPESVTETWEPAEIDARHVLILSDLHIPYHSNIAVQTALDHGTDFKPDAVLINGDLFDFYQLSRFDKNPTLPKVSAELLAGGQFLDHVRARFPKAKLYFKLGNHDERWADYLFKVAPLLSDIEAVTESWRIPAGIDRNRVTVIGDQRPIMLGKLPVLHGHELGRSMFSPVNPARGAFLRSHHTILVGHSHQSSGHADTNIWHDETFCWSTGCLCGLWPAYARVNRWNWGFATVQVNRDGSFDVQNMRIAKNGKVRTS